MCPCIMQNLVLLSADQVLGTYYTAFSLLMSARVRPGQVH